MSNEIQSISQGNYILQGTVATSAGIVGDGTTQNPLRADETVLWESTEGGRGTLTLSDDCNSYDRLRIYWDVWNQGDYRRNITELDASVTKGLLTATYFNTTNNAFFSMLYTVSLSGTSFSILGNRYNNWTNNTVTDGGTNSITIYKVVGINRKAQ